MGVLIYITYSISHFQSQHTLTFIIDFEHEPGYLAVSINSMAKTIRIIQNTNPESFIDRLSVNLIKCNTKRVCIFPPTNIYETDNRYIIMLAVPGYSEHDFTVHTHANKIVITAVHRSIWGVNGKTVRKEFDILNFTRNYILPAQYVGGSFSYQYENGLLTLFVHKKQH